MFCWQNKPEMFIFLKNVHTRLFTLMRWNLDLYFARFSNTMIEIVNVLNSTERNTWVTFRCRGGWSCWIYCSFLSFHTWPPVCVVLKVMVSLCASEVCTQWTILTLPTLLPYPNLLFPLPPFLTCSLRSSTPPSVSVFTQFCPQTKATAESKMNSHSSCLPQMNYFYI